ncbi:PEGA domain-containing protein [Lujinxingia sediminis]|uniref:PEGA domain-containing protein n=2 Tax=Lujinxingia sediminis TaxID=2480984 RepID=A0ABY0CYI5_9DELT|nr:PEGA domain-containing protein [Lujinxingia sediminis]
MRPRHGLQGGATFYEGSDSRDGKMVERAEAGGQGPTFSAAGVRKRVVLRTEIRHNGGPFPGPEFEVAMIETGEKFGKYTLLQRIAVGGMAEIFKARTDGVDGFAKVLAIKRLHRQFSEDSEFASMLIDEAKLVVQLNHANIGQIFDLGVVSGQYYIAMEFIEGLDLHELSERVQRQHRQLPTEVAVYVAMEVAEALHYAHTKLGADRKPLELVHRDVSPQNVMLSVDGEVKLVDFGIAKARMRAEQTQAGIIKGKFYYMSPEQALGHHIDGRTDVYALGMVLYEVLSGEHPFDRVPDGELLRAVRQADFPPIEEVVPDLSPGLVAVMRRALMRNPELRYSSALELRRDLAEVARRELNAMGRMEMAEFVRAYLDAHLPEETRAAGFEAMQRGEFEASQNSVIFDARAAGLDDDGGFAEDAHTQIFMREDEHDDLEADAATAMVDWGEHDGGETTEDRPALRSGAQAVVHPDDVMTREARPPAHLLADSAAVPTAASQAVEKRQKAQVGFGPSLSEASLAAQPAHKASQRESVHGTQPRATAPAPLKARIDHMVRTRPHLVGAALALLAIGVVGVAGVMLMGGSGERSDAELAVASAPAAATHTDLMVSTEPANARVYLDDAFVGATPTTLSDLRVGRGYALRFERDGYDVSELNLVAEVGMHPVVVQLEALGGILKITTSPPGASVYVNGDLLGTSPVTAMGLARDEEHKVYAELEGAEAQQHEIVWGEDDPRVRDVHLSFDLPEKPAPKAASASAPRRERRAPQRRRASQASATTAEERASAEALDIWELGGAPAEAGSGRLNVRVEGADEARIYIDGALVASSPRLNGHALAPGQYDVRVYFTTLKRYSETRRVRVRSDDVASLTFRP